VVGETACLVKKRTKKKGLKRRKGTMEARKPVKAITWGTPML